MEQRHHPGKPQLTLMKMLTGAKDKTAEANIMGELKRRVCQGLENFAPGTSRMD